MTILFVAVLSSRPRTRVRASAPAHSSYRHDLILSFSRDPALDRLLDFAAEAGLVVLIHNDIDTPFAKEGAEPAYLTQVEALFKRHPKATIIWAHIGTGLVIRPVKRQGVIVEQMLRDAALGHVYFDISWDEVAKYAVATPESTKTVADLINRHPNRFLFGTDEVAPPTPGKNT